jgi:selenocysteine lyase/cysteine desulfurase
MTSAVLFRNARIVGGLEEVMHACAATGSELLVDAYHAVNAIPFSVRRLGLERAFVTGGGYKYCQLGEGNAFLRYPRDCRLRPVITGWYAEFDSLTGRPDGRVDFGNGPHRFDGATYDPASHYRAAAVMRFHEEQGITPEVLREVSQHQVGLLMARFDSLGLAPDLIDRDRSTAPEDIAGFLTLVSPRAGEVCEQLNQRGVMCDYRDDALRLGPAPYLSDDQIVTAVDILGEVCRGGSA